MTETWPEVMVTAHRRLPAGVEDWLDPMLRDLLRRLTGDYGLKQATCGMAAGGDQKFGLAARDLSIPLRAAIPYPSQPLDGQRRDDGTDRPGPRWTKQAQRIWAELETYADLTGGVAHVSPTDPVSAGQRVALLHARNDWMLRNTQQVIGIWAPGNLRSGTASCLRKAVSAGFSPILINLASKRLTRPEPKHWAAYLDMPALLETN